VTAAGLGTAEITVTALDADKTLFAKCIIEVVPAKSPLVIIEMRGGGGGCQGPGTGAAVLGLAAVLALLARRGARGAPKA
jgi:hypothetical protein